MESNHHIWRGWAVILHNWGLNEVVASFLEAFGSLSLLAAQLVYLGQPLLGGLAPPGYMQALAVMLEDNSNREVFLGLLRGEMQA
jgi:hypothetical protein